MTVAALYVDPAGVYAGLDGVEVWDEARDARLYAGPWPVVAHPPCNHWCQLASVNAARYERFEIGDDGGCFWHALNAVHRFGGVLEHPAYSLAWPEFDLPYPVRGVWRQTFFDPGYVTEVSQVAYGHTSRKRTWLYYIGDDPPMMDWSEPPHVTVVGAGINTGQAAGQPRDEFSLHTPPAFRDALLEMARNAKVAACA